MKFIPWLRYINIKQMVLDKNRLALSFVDLVTPTLSIRDRKVNGAVNNNQTKDTVSIICSISWCCVFNKHLALHPGPTIKTSMCLINTFTSLLDQNHISLSLISFTGSSFKTALLSYCFTQFTVNAIASHSAPTFFTCLFEDNIV